MKTFAHFSLVLAAIMLFANTSKGQDSWTKKADFPGVGRGYSSSFSIGDRAYVGGGDTTDDFNSGLPIKNDFWEYNPDSNKWTQKASIPGNPRFGAVCFSIGNKGFIGGGNAGNDFWEYDPAKNTWTRKADVPGSSRLYPVSFSIGGKGYTGMGFVWGAGNILNDFWEYDTITNRWTRKANFAGVPTFYGIGFSIGNKGYAGTGIDSTNINAYNEFWEYNPSNDKWTQKASIGYHGRYEGIGFSMANMGYFGFGVIDSVGVENDMWAYDTTANQWNQMSYCDVNYSVFAPFAFSIGNKGFVGSGEDDNGIFHNDLYQYTNHTSNINAPKSLAELEVYPNPNTGSFLLNSSYLIDYYEICDMNGKLIYGFTNQNKTNSINVNLSLQNGVYLLKTISKEGTAVRKIVIDKN